MESIASYDLKLARPARIDGAARWTSDERFVLLEFSLNISYYELIQLLPPTGDFLAIQILSGTSRLWLMWCPYSPLVSEGIFLLH